ncbi:MAG: hypothetical protein HOB26_07365 [Flavobacteriales bacterium]|jgi:hypothetical protein|nr:hypothetical protein [Flavobacteriales bacterium]
MKIAELLKGYVRDALEFMPRNFPKPLAGMPEHLLTDTQIYPIGTNFNKALELTTKKRFNTLLIQPDTTISSIGTCFAEELATFMMNGKDKGIGKYVYVENNVFNSSANWGRVYTIQNFLQIVKYSVTDTVPVYIDENDKGFIDPLREYSVGNFTSREAAEIGIKNHRAASRDVFKNSKILVLTLGQNEGWLDNEISLVLGSAPRPKLRETFPDRFRVMEFGFAQNLNDLTTAIELLKEFNSDLKFIITVSPVAAHATFIDQDVITQSFAGKCQLRSVVHQLQKNIQSDIYYFPSFEMALCNNTESFRADNRHVKRWKVREIFSLLEKILKK